MGAKAPGKEDVMNKDLNFVLESRAEMINGILEGMDAEFSVSYERIPKNNVTKDAYILRPRRDGYMSPTIYLNGELLGLTDGELACELISLYSRHRCSAPDIEAITSRDRIIETVLPRLVSAKNAPRLDSKGIEYEEWLDMLIYYYMPVHEFGNDDSIATIAVTRAMMERADINPDELKAAAISNMDNTAEVVCMSDVLESLGVPEIGSDVTIPIMVVSTRSRNLGAGAILAPRVLDILQSRLGSCFYILPSSIHECLAVPASAGTDAVSLVSMVREINGSTVALEDQLTDNAYICKDGEVSVVG